ncbi:MAG: CTP synthase [Alphaproteobacteria bacterium RIFCSPHIGHO2_01_FULL_41_14]|nr:MAG: CTP synthase [Alphaproteobacteria bacterium GWA1_45_9]OFW90142.1 MAG: CTP synthase [Alphaproteobacteria bacterium RIFCSPHIGHO2_01_FULL_41_14]HCI48508.1 CTP synthetase [Holosporales bacterium]
MTYYIFVTGGVLSSLGKGIAASSIGTLLQANGYKVCLRKMDPYINVDPGTMNPYQHGEVFVTNDGVETDMDLGHYERFTNVDARKSDTITTGQIYWDVIERERRGEYLGGTVQVIPHITNRIKEFIGFHDEDLDFLITEVGGTVGDIESLPFIEALRQFSNDIGRKRSLFVHLTLLPYIATTGELKTKPTQHSVKELLSYGIQPDILLCRSEKQMSAEERTKLSLFCNIPEDRVLSALDAGSIYEVPLMLHKQNLDKEILSYFGIFQKKAPDLNHWQKFVENQSRTKHTVTIGLIGKYVSLQDAYKSIHEALIHGGVHLHTQVQIRWIDADTLIPKTYKSMLSELDGILVPGGFGGRGVDGKMLAIRYARENNVPFFGICFGLQLSLIEIARQVAGLKEAGSTELENPKTPVVCLMGEWEKEGALEARTEQSDKGGTMRLGNYPCTVLDRTKAYEAYQGNMIQERHRHRYEVNIKYKADLEKAGVVFSGMSPDGKLPEIIELKDHAWFVAVQFHPELKSRPFSPHPLFVSFLKAALKRK